MTKNARAHQVAIGCLAAAVFATAPAAQHGPARAPHVGRVLDASGKPVGSAVVTCVSGREHGALATDDIVSATTDPNGRFRTSLLPTRRYAVWAALAAADGTRVSEVVQRVATTTELVLDVESAPAPVQFTVSGTAAFGEHGPLRVQLVVLGSETLVPSFELAADGSAPLGPLPRILVEARVFARDRLVHSTMTSIGSPLILPAPRVVTARVADAAGKPVPGALLCRTIGQWSDLGGPFPRCARGDRYELARTDAGGTAELLFAHGNDPFQGVGYPALVFVASKPGHRDSVSGFTGVPVCNGVVAEAKKLAGSLTFVLEPQAEPTFKIEAATGQLPPELRLLGLLSMPFDANSTTSAHDFVRVPIGPDGTVVVPSHAANEQRLAVQVPGQLPPLADDDPYRRVAVPRTLVLPAQALDGPSLDLRLLVPLRLAVLDATSGPAMGAAVLCTPRNGDQFVAAEHAMQAVTDATGRLVLPVMPGTWMVVVVQGGTWARVTLEVERELPPQQLQLGPLDRMVVRVVDGDGKPVAGAHFDSGGSSWGGGGSAEDSFLCSLGNAVSNWLLPQQVTDAEGRAAIPFLANKWLKVDFVARHAGKQSQELYLRADEEPIEIVVK